MIMGLHACRVLAVVERHRLGCHVGGGSDNQSSRNHLRRIVPARLAQALI